MKIILTGGTGLIGRALADSLLVDGHEVVILTRSAGKTTPSPRLRHVQWDGKTANGWQDEVRTADAIVNLAGAGIADARWSAERKQEIVDSRVDAGRAVSQALQNVQGDGKSRVLIQASAVGYYGVTGDTPITEGSAPGTDFLAETCVAWEESSADVESFGVRRAVARTGVVFSTEGGALPQILLPFKMVVAGGPIGSGEQYVPWIHIDDEVRALRWMIENPNARGPYNLSAPNPVKNRDLAQTVGEVMNRPSLIPTPAFALKTVMGERATLVLDGQRQLPQRLLAEGFIFNHPELRPALQALLHPSRAKQQLAMAKLDATTDSQRAA
jgi:uncharacterized protein (TIGR01777 family)